MFCFFPIQYYLLISPYLLNKAGIKGMSAKYIIWGLVSVFFLVVWFLLLSLVQEMVSAKNTLQNIMGVIIFLSTALLSGFFIIKGILLNSIKK